VKLDSSKIKGDAMKFKIKKNSAGQRYLQLVAGNDQIVATAGESFASKDNAKRAAENVKTNAGSASIEAEGDGSALMNAVIRQAARRHL
jgi:uncharacterized protein YegP (UPF0339 family)